MPVPDYVPPQNIEAEQALLGALLMNNAVWSRVSPILREDQFADPLHGRIYRACGVRIDKGRDANPTTLATFFEDDPAIEDAGGPDYLARLMASAITVINAEDFAQTIVDMWQRREALAMLNEAIEAVAHVDIETTAGEIIGKTVAELERVTGEGAAQFRTAREVRLASVESMREDIPCTTTGFPRLDKAMGGGLYAGKLYGIIARKKAGKTLVGSAIGHAAVQSSVEDETPRRVLYIAGEMGAEGIEQRQWAKEVNVNSLAFLDRRRRSDPQFLHVVGEASFEATENLMYVQLPGMTFEKMRRVLSQFRAAHRDSVGFVLDYLQLVRGRPKGTNQAEFLDEVSQWLADFCNQSGLWGVVLAQENQEGNVRGGEGLRLACDMAFALERTNDGEGTEAWMQMIETRYTPWANVGSADDPAFRLNTQTGPFYEEVEPVDDSAQMAVEF